MTKLLVIVASLLVAIAGEAGFSGAESDCASAKNYEIQEARGYVASFLGGELTDSSVYAGKSGYRISYSDTIGYWVEFHLIASALDGAVATFRVYSDDEGKLSCGIATELPDCVGDSKNCEFSITSSDAINIAKEHGLLSTEGEYTAVFGLLPLVSGFGWEVHGYNPRSTSFRAVFVDACTGEVVREVHYELER